MSREIKSPPAKVDVSRSFDGKHVIEFNEASHRYKLDGKQCCGVTTFIKGGYPTSQGLISWQKGQALEYLWNAIAAHTEPGGMMVSPAFIIPEAKAEMFKAAKAADRAVSQEAADIGTLIHEYAFLYETKGDSFNELTALSKTVEQLPKEISTKIYNGIEKFKAWRATVDDRLQSVEQLVASPTHLFCGKFDKLAYRGGKLILSDYKSSKSIYLEFFIQLAAYRAAIREWLGLEVEGLEILRFGKEDGEFETMLVSEPKELDTFEAQAIRCRETYEFQKLNNDPRWKYEPK